MAWRPWTGKGLSLPPSVGEWGKESVLNVLICRDLPRPQPHRCSPEQKVFALQLQYHKGDMATQRPASECIPTQNPSWASGRFVVPRFKQSLSPLVKGTGKKLYFKEKSLRKDSHRVAVLLLCLPKGPHASSTTTQYLNMNTVSCHGVPVKHASLPFSWFS